MPPEPARSGDEPVTPPPDARREVSLALDGRGHDLVVGYTVETPIWRPSYRLVFNARGGAQVQAWGIVQNLSGEDWRDVRLSLVAGAPVSFRSELAQAVIPQRPVVTDRGAVIDAVPLGETTLAEAPRPTPAATAAPMAAPAPTPTMPQGGYGGGGGRSRSQAARRPMAPSAGRAAYDDLSSLEGDAPVCAAASAAALVPGPAQPRVAGRPRGAGRGHPVRPAQPRDGARSQRHHGDARGARPAWRAHVPLRARPRRGRLHAPPLPRRALREPYRRDARARPHRHLRGGRLPRPGHARTAARRRHHHRALRPRARPRRRAQRRERDGGRAARTHAARGAHHRALPRHAHDLPRAQRPRPRGARDVASPRRGQPAALRAARGHGDVQRQRARARAG